jgi:LysM repeat protein
MMKQWMVRLTAALTLAVTVALAAPQANAQGQKPAGGGGQLSDADKKSYETFQKKANAIQTKYKPQLEGIQKKYKTDMEALKKKYEPKMAAIQKEGQGLKPEDQKGPKGQAVMQKMVGIQKQMMNEPSAKKMLGDLKPVIKKMSDEVLAAAPAKFKPMVKQQIDMQMKQLGG